MERKKAAAASHLALDDRRVFRRSEVRRFLELVAIAPIADDHDRIRILERRGIFRPAILMKLDADLIPDIRPIEHHFDQPRRPRIIVDVIAFGAVAFLPGDDDDLFRRGNGRRGRGATEQKREEETNERHED